MDVQIRSMLETDIARVAELYAGCFREPPWHERFDLEEVRGNIRKTLTWPDTVCFVAEADGAPIGVTWGYDITRKTELRTLLPDCQDHFYIAEVFVESAKRVRGVASQIVNACVDEAKLRGLTRGAVRTSVDQPIIRKMFERRDWQIVAHEDVQSEKDFGQGPVLVPDRRIILTGVL